MVIVGVTIYLLHSQIYNTKISNDALIVESITHMFIKLWMITYQKVKI